MTTELEALVGHLFIVGGRMISAASPGSIAMPPPRRPARGRETDTLFGLLTLGPGEHRPATFYEGLSDQFSTAFYQTSGSVTSALRKAITLIHDAMAEVNARQADPVELGLACAVLREHELYLAVVGPARCFLIRDGFVERLPTDVEMAEGMVGLGVEEEAFVRFYRREIRAADFLILADSSFNRLTDTTLRHTVDSSQVDDTLNNLAAVASELSTAEIIKFVTPLAEGEIDEIPPSRKRSKAPPLPRFGPSEGRAAPPASLPDGEPAPASEPAAGRPADAAGAAAQEEDRFSLRGMSRNLVLGMARAVDGISTLVKRRLPEDDTGSPTRQRVQVSVPMQIGVAVAVAVLVALITTAVYRFRGQTSQYAQLVREAQQEVERARGAGSDQAAARPHWETAVFLLDQASAIRSPGHETAELRSEALRVLDSYDHVTRVAPALLRTYEPGTYLRGPVVQGLNLYVIDTTKDILYREDLNEAGTGLVNRDPQVVTRQGDLIGNQVIGGLIDLTWMEDGGVPQRNVLAVLSRNGLLITYSPSWDVAATLLPGFEGWRDPRAIAIYNRDLYILDAGANEIWRYAARGDSYTNAPQRYFTDFVPDLSDAIDMDIDTNGNIYVLHASGQISKFSGGRAEPFAFSGLPQPVSRPTALFLNISLYDRTLFVTDPGGGRLYSTALNGAFLSNYKDADDSIFKALSGVYNQDRPPFVYLSAGNQLYYFSRP